MDLMYIENKARQYHSSDTSGHDFSHIERVKNTALKIAIHYPDVDTDVICCAALLHDVADHKIIKAEDTDRVINMMRNWIYEAGGSNTIARHILHICQNISFSTRDKNDSLSLEGQIVQDADRLDALGAIGIARTFAYGGAKGRKMYADNGNDTLSHFYEKLLMIKELMNTHIGRQMAIERHLFMEKFLSHFYEECSLK